MVKIKNNLIFLSVLITFAITFFILRKFDVLKKYLVGILSLSQTNLLEENMYNLYIDQDIIRCDLNFRAELFEDRGFYLI